MLNIERFQCNMLEENCYIVSDDTQECVIIDCGAYYEEERQAIVDYIRKNNFLPKHLLVTHGHLDHNFGNDTIFKEFKLKPECDAHDEHLMQTLKQQAESFYHLTLDINFPAIDHFFEDGEKIQFGTHQFTVIPTPGHSKGSVCFYCEAEHTLFSGDTLFKSSIGRTDFPQGSMFQIIQSLRQLAQLPDETTVLPGHGDKTTIGLEVAANPYMDR